MATPKAHHYKIQAYDEYGNFIDEKEVNSDNEFNALLTGIYRLRADALREQPNQDERTICASVHVVEIDGDKIGMP